MLRRQKFCPMHPFFSRQIQACRTKRKTEILQTPCLPVSMQENHHANPAILLLVLSACSSKAIQCTQTSLRHKAVSKEKLPSRHSNRNLWRKLRYLLPQEKSCHFPRAKNETVNHHAEMRHNFEMFSLPRTPQALLLLL